MVFARTCMWRLWRARSDDWTLHFRSRQTQAPAVPPRFNTKGGEIALEHFRICVPMCSLLFLFTLLIGCGAQLVPIFGIAECAPGELCQQKLTVQVYLNQASNGNYQLDATIADQPIVDSVTGRTYKPQSPISISVFWQNIRFGIHVIISFFF